MFPRLWFIFPVISVSLDCFGPRLRADLNSPKTRFHSWQKSEFMLNRNTTGQRPSKHTLSLYPSSPSHTLRPQPKADPFAQLNKKLHSSARYTMLGTMYKHWHCLSGTGTGSGSGSGPGLAPDLAVGAYLGAYFSLTLFCTFQLKSVRPCTARPRAGESNPKS